MFSAVPLPYDIQKHITNYIEFRRYLVLVGKNHISRKLLQDNIFRFVYTTRELYVYGNQKKEIPANPNIDTILFWYDNDTLKIPKNYEHIKKFNFICVGKLHIPHIIAEFPNMEEFKCCYFRDVEGVIALNKNIKKIYCSDSRFRIKIIRENPQIEFTMAVYSVKSAHKLDKKCREYIRNLKIVVNLKINRKDYGKDLILRNYEVVELRIDHCRTKAEVFEVYPQFRNIRKLSFTISHMNTRFVLRLASLPNLETVIIRSIHRGLSCEVEDIDFLIWRDTNMKSKIMYDHTKTNILLV